MSVEGRQDGHAGNDDADELLGEADSNISGTAHGKTLIVKVNTYLRRERIIVSMDWFLSFLTAS